MESSLTAHDHIALAACEDARENEAAGDYGLPDEDTGEGGECENCYEYTPSNFGNEDELLCEDCGTPEDPRDRDDRMGRTHS